MGTGVDTKRVHDFELETQLKRNQSRVAFRKAQIENEDTQSEVKSETSCQAPRKVKKTHSYRKMANKLLQSTTALADANGDKARFQAACNEQMAVARQEAADKLAELTLRLSAAEDDKARLQAVCNKQLVVAHQEAAEKLAELTSRLSAAEGDKARLQAVCNKQLMVAHQEAAEKLAELTSRLSAAEGDKARIQAVCNERVVQTSEEAASIIAMLESDLENAHSKLDSLQTSYEKVVHARRGVASEILRLNEVLTATYGARASFWIDFQKEMERARQVTDDELSKLDTDFPTANDARASLQGNYSSENAHGKNPDTEGMQLDSAVVITTHRTKEELESLCALQRVSINALRDRVDELMMDLQCAEKDAVMRLDVGGLSIKGTNSRAKKGKCTKSGVKSRINKAATNTGKPIETNGAKVITLQAAMDAMAIGSSATSAKSCDGNKKSA